MMCSGGSAQEPANCEGSTCSSTDQVGLLQQSTYGRSHLRNFEEESQIEEKPTDTYIVKDEVKCLYGDGKCPYGSPKESEFYGKDDYSNVDTEEKYKSQPCTGTRKGEGEKAGCDGSDTAPLVCDKDDAPCTCSKDKKAQARSSWKPSTNHCSDPTDEMNEDDKIKKCCDGHDYCYTTALTTKKGCDAAFGNCLMQTADYSEYGSEEVLDWLKMSYFVESQQYAVECV